MYEVIIQRNPKMTTNPISQGASQILGEFALAEFGNPAFHGLDLAIQTEQVPIMALNLILLKHLLTLLETPPDFSGLT